MAMVKSTTSGFTLCSGPPGVALDAIELDGEESAGYRFQAIGEPEGDLLVLLARLIEKIRRALSVKHITRDDAGVRHIAGHGIVRGRIEWSEFSDDGVPCVVVDGRAVDWNDFGRMLMVYEGSHFRLHIQDQSEEV